MQPVLAVNCMVVVIAVVAPDRSTDIKFEASIDVELVPTPPAAADVDLLAICFVCDPALRKVNKHSTVGDVFGVFDSTTCPPMRSLKNLLPDAVSPDTSNFHSISPLFPIGVRLIPLSAVISEVGVVMRPDGDPAKVVGDPTICGCPPVYWSL